MSRLTIDLDALAHNHAVLRAAAGGAEIAPVVKADGYGLGAVPVARRLIAEGARTFYVARLGEGEALRAALGPGPAIFVFDGATPGSAERLEAASLTPVINSLEQAALWPGRPCALHVDTGMNRLGLRLEEAGDARVGRLDVRILLSHLACAPTPSHPLNTRQRERFEAARALFPGARASLANSAGTFLPGFAFDQARTGISLYGGGPCERPDPRLRPVATFEAPVLQVRDVPAGESVGYGAEFTADAPMRVAIVGAGYADGYLRAFHPGGQVWLGGARRRLLGRVSMDMIAVDVTDAEVAPGDMAELIGANIPLDEAAATARTSAYELLTRLGPRSERAWLGGA